MKALSARRIIPGVNVVHQGGLFQVVDIINTTEILVKSTDGQRRVLDASSVSVESSCGETKLPDLAKLKGKRWAEALEIYEHIRPLVDMGRHHRSRADVGQVADKMGKHIATVYRWLETYEQSGMVSSLLRKQRSDKGTVRIPAEVEAVIKETIEDFHLTSQRRTPTKTAAEVRKRCIQACLSAPDEKTVRTRINAVSGELQLRRREGAKAAAERYIPIRGSFPGADFPLAVVQIDHTPMDVIVVDDIHRKPINRPWLTTAIDVCSRMVVGYYISLDHPGALSTGLCISRAILGKEIFLSKMGIDHLTWPCWGVMAKIHTDNAKEFRGTMLARAAMQYGIVQERRPKGRPNFGGHVERAFRTHMAEIHNELPGTTFSNVKFKREYDSEGRAVMTLDALEHWFTVFILGVYHQKPHSGINGMPPIVKWEQAILGTDAMLGTGIPARIADEDRLRLDFMPYFERTVQEYGIQNEGVCYWTDALRRFVHMRDPKRPSNAKTFVCRYDPRDLSCIWLYDDETDQYIEIPYRNLSRPSISLWELRNAKYLLKEQYKTATNEELIFKSIDQMREIVEKESAKTKAARRMRQRKKQWDAAPKLGKANKKIVKLPEPAPDSEDFGDIVPFGDIRES
jgi:putative transposase